MRNPTLALLVLPLMACTTTTPAEPVGSGSPAGACDAGAVRSFVGQTASPASGAGILRASGATSLRWGPPDSAWTMDYRPDRVNVRYDQSMTITEVTCG
jgi:hypothetical protein